MCVEIKIGGQIFLQDSAIIILVTQNFNCNLQPAIEGPIQAHPIPNQAALTPKQQWLLLNRCALILSREQRNCNMKLVSRFLKFLTSNSVGHFTSEICAELTSTNWHRRRMCSSTLSSVPVSRQISNGLLQEVLDGEQDAIEPNTVVSIFGALLQSLVLSFDEYSGSLTVSVRQ